MLFSIWFKIGAKVIKRIQKRNLYYEQFATSCFQTIKNVTAKKTRTGGNVGTFAAR